MSKQIEDQEKETDVQYVQIEPLPLDVEKIAACASDWGQYLYDCTPLDRCTVASAVQAVYRQLGLDTPTIVYVLSPFQLACVPWLAKEIAGLDFGRNKELGENLSQHLAGKIDKRVSNPWRPKCADRWWLSLENELDNSGLGWLMHYPAELCQPVWFQMPGTRLSTTPRVGKVFDHICDELGAHPFWAQVCEVVGKPAPDSSFWTRAKEAFEVDGFTVERGCMWLWNRAYDFAFSDVLQTLPWYKPSAKLAQHWAEWTRLVKATHGFLLFDDICFVSERPLKLTLDAEQRLHNLSGPALEYADGFGVYAWHRNRVEWNDAYIIEKPEDITIDLIDRQQDAATRAVMIRQYDEERFLSGINAIELDRDDHGVLYRRAPSRHRHSELLVKVLDPTETIDGAPPTYYFSAKKDVTTARDAVIAAFWINPYNAAHGETLSDVRKNGLRKSSAEKSASDALHSLLWSIAPKLPSDFEPYGQRSRTDSSEGKDVVSDCSSNCKHFQVLQSMPHDWGVCTNKRGPRCGLLTFEHQGCHEFEPALKDESDGTDNCTLARLENFSLQ
ncbi:MAG TPA: hypothetical protein V6C81_28255 [Planktothrix sp.]|jgi:hypothetical protein